MGRSGCNRPRLPFHWLTHLRQLVHLSTVEAIAEENWAMQLIGQLPELDWLPLLGLCLCWQGIDGLHQMTLAASPKG
ncbi:MAG: hypothetical protein RLZZ336_900 [Cyanobacteriota bacterium]|jgi:hypothetical protein